MTAKDLDQAYVLLSQTITRIPREDHELYLARLVLLLLASHPEAEAAIAAIRDAEPTHEAPEALPARAARRSPSRVRPR
jgi:hypothetical protein